MRKLFKPIKADLVNMRLNRTLHGRSKYRSRDVPGHNVIKGFSKPGNGDGLDLFCAAGTAVHAMHAGKITRIADPDGRLGCVYVDGVVDGVSVTSVYAHLHVKEKLNVGDEIEADQILGYVGRVLKDPHLHLELWIDGEVVANDTARGLVKKIAALVV